MDSKAIKANTCSWWSESLVTMGNWAKNQLLSPRTENTDGHGFWLHLLSCKRNSASVWIRPQSLHWGLETKQRWWTPRLLITLWVLQLGACRARSFPNAVKLGEQNIFWSCLTIGPKLGAGYFRGTVAGSHQAGGAPMSHQPQLEKYLNSFYFPQFLFTGLK